MKTISNILVHISKIPKIFHPKCLDNKTHGEKLIYACRLLVGTRVVTLNTMDVFQPTQLSSSKRKNQLMKK